jgi:hypothetical protein
MRFITPLIPLLCLYCVLGFVEVVKYVDARIPQSSAAPTMLRVTPYVLATSLAAVSVYFAVAQRTGPLLHSVELSADQQELFDWLRANVKEDDVVIMGPTNHYWGYLWYANFKGSLLPTPGNVSAAHDSFEAFSASLKKRRVSVIVLHEENYRSAGALDEYFGYDDVDGLIERQPPKDWKPVYEFSKRPCAFRIYRL